MPTMNIWQILCTALHLRFRCYVGLQQSIDIFPLRSVIGLDHKNDVLSLVQALHDEGAQTLKLPQVTVLTSLVRALYPTSYHSSKRR